MCWLTESSQSLELMTGEQKWIASQAVQLARIESDCDPLRVWRAGYQGC